MVWSARIGFCRYFFVGVDQFVHNIPFELMIVGVCQIKVLSEIENLNIFLGRNKEEIFLTYALVMQYFKKQQVLISALKQQEFLQKLILTY